MESTESYKKVFFGSESVVYLNVPPVSRTFQPAILGTGKFFIGDSVSPSFFLR